MKSVLVQSVTERKKKQFYIGLSGYILLDQFRSNASRLHK